MLFLYLLNVVSLEHYPLCCVQPIFFQKFHFAFIFYFPSGTDFQLIYRGVVSNNPRGLPQHTVFKSSNVLFSFNVIHSIRRIWSMHIAGFQE